MSHSDDYITVPRALYAAAKEVIGESSDEDWDDVEYTDCKVSVFHFFNGSKLALQEKLIAAGIPFDLEWECVGAMGSIKAVRFTSRGTLYSKVLDIHDRYLSPHDLYKLIETPDQLISKIRESRRSNLIIPLSETQVRNGKRYLTNKLIEN